MSEPTNTSSDPPDQPPSPRRPMLELRGVTFGYKPETSLCVDQTDLIVKEGGLVVIRTNASQAVRAFASMLQGLKSPRKGNVLFDDRDWGQQSMESQFAMRGRIGRVFDGQGWIANLSVRENLLLAKTHHRGDDSRTLDEIREWMRWFQLGNMTRKRPAFVEESHLQVYQWIRAFVGKPSLLILERPLRKAASRAFDRFMEAVQEMRQRGAAVIWIAGNSVEQLLDTDSSPLVLDLRPGGNGLKNGSGSGGIEQNPKTDRGES
ncbi:MAG: hypothetical protein AAF989_04510 [Planctomycetota bacterium]